MTPPARSVPVTVVIAAKNEADNMDACIDAVRWAERVVVADHGSTDETAARARAAGAEVLSVADAPTIGALRNAAIESATTEWVLVVDADERASPALGDAVDAAVAASRAAAYRVPRRNFFLGREVRHGGWERDRPIRLFRRDLRYDANRVHERVVVDGEPATLAAGLQHYPYRSLDAYFEKFERYSRWWAEDRYARGQRASLVDVVVKPPARFVSMYVFRGGFLDGAPGVLLAALASASVLAKYARLYGLARGA